MSRKLLAVLLLAVIASGVYAAPRWMGVDEPLPARMEVLEQNSNFVEIEFNCRGLFFNRESDGTNLFSLDGVKSGDIPAFTRMLAVPAYRQVEFDIVSAEYAEIDFDQPLFRGNGAVEVGEPVVIRDLRAVPVTVYPLQSSKVSGKARLLTKVVIRIHFKGFSGLNNKDFTGATSPAFSGIYRSMVMNYDGLDNGGDPSPKGTYLIIAPEAYTTVSQYDDFVEWKKMKGYQVQTHVLTSQPPSADYIKNIIIGVHQNADPPLEYVMLLGDVNGGSITIPAYITQGAEQDVTDHPYTLLEGDDYFSDIFIGRISVSNTNEARVTLNKVVRYEKNPFTGSTHWYRHMLSVAGNYADSGLPPITPVQTGWWIADYFLHHGYTQADTIFFWDFIHSPYPNTQAILSSINDGKSVVTYRGWSDAHGWQFPVFDISAIEMLNNRWMLPVVLSFVCNTGDFGNSINPCFGEKFIRHGTTGSGGAAVAFFGPSDLNTNTNFNNAISSGFVEGFIGHRITHFGQTAAYGKMSLYEAYPRDRERNGKVEFYFNVYNCLGDPELEMWTAVPRYFILDCPVSTPLGTASLDVELTRDGNPVPEAYVTVLQGGELVEGGYTGRDGRATLTFAPLTAGSATVTATKYGFAPRIVVVDVNSNAYVGYDSHTLVNESNPDGMLNPGETATVRVTVENYGSAVQNNVTGVLTSANPYLTVNTSSVNAGSIGSGATADMDFNITVSPDAPSQSAVDFELNITASGGNYESKFSQVLDGSEIAVQEVNYSPLHPGQGGPVTVTLANNGGFTASNVSLTLSSWDEAVTVTGAAANVGGIPPSQTVNTGSQLTVDISAGAYEGRMIQMRLGVSPQVGAAQTLFFDIVVGEPDSTDPTGPDPYGYFAYDDSDVGYASAPVYDWVELDPNYPGAVSGVERLNMEDDSSTMVPLPFDFTFYGETYDSVTICTNGWVSFVSTWMADFRNWDLPSPLGPPTLIAAFWDDLKDIYDDTLDMFYWYDSPGHRFIVEWSRVQNRFTGVANREETFELILYDPQYRSGPTGDGDILIQFKVVNDIDEDNNYCTVGVEDYEHMRGLEYVYGLIYPPTSATLRNEMAILITTTPPDNYLGVEEQPGTAVYRFSLSQNYPNPFNASTVASFELRDASDVKLIVYDISGREIARLVDGWLPAGAHQAVWDASGAASGVYFARLSAGDAHLTEKLLLIK